MTARANHGVDSAGLALEAWQHLDEKADVGRDVAAISSHSLAAELIELSG